MNTPDISGTSTHYRTGNWSVNGVKTTNVMPIYSSLDLLGVDA
ncbi:MAG: hypothetical protein SWJ54_03335 [Cyanobacteriota bacterium]|nr:hypothetical protein [Cyanobacteriota bacterium]